MKIIVTGAGGFFGRHVVSVLRSLGDTVLTFPGWSAQAMIHLAWAGLPNYEREAHFSNVEWQFEMIKKATERGITNITVSGTSLETAEKAPAYALAKLELHRRLEMLPIDLKWVRFPSLYGFDQPGRCLLPSLLRAVERGDRQFHVAKTSKVFVPVREAAWRIRLVAEPSSRRLVEYSEQPEPVADFCRRMVPPGAIELVEDYPLEAWEKQTP